MIGEKIVRELAQSRLDEFDGFIVDLSISSNNHIKLVIDSDTSIAVSDCISVSRNVEHNLDREVEDFSLEVSSAGLDQPFKHFRQYKKNEGRDVKVKLVNEKVIKGLLKLVDEDKIVVITQQKERIEGRKAKRWVETEQVLKFSEIKETKVIISFK